MNKSFITINAYNTYFNNSSPHLALGVGFQREPVSAAINTSEIICYYGVRKNNDEYGTLIKTYDGIVYANETPKQIREKIASIGKGKFDIAGCFIPVFMSLGTFTGAAFCFLSPKSAPSIIAGSISTILFWFGMVWLSNRIDKHI